MSERKGATNVVWHAGTVTGGDRAKLLGHRGAVVWLTGLSGSGKSTIGHRLEQLLVDRGALAYVLDGDNLRHGLCADLGFSAEARVENVRRTGEVAAILLDAGVIVITALISPFRADRDRVRARIRAGAFFEVHVATPIEECERRDPKGLYGRARAGEIRDFTGISSPYEAPASPEVRVASDGESVEESALAIIGALEAAGVLSP
jgi:adenylylsulfate kinase